MKFTKIQAAGNDYVLVEGDTGKDWPKLARAVLDRHYGIGADGLLVMLPSDKADFKMRIFNVDGSESNACGNGLRSMVRYYADRANTEGIREITAETMAGIRKAFITVSGGEISGIKTGMGVPLLAKKDIPVSIPENSDETAVIKGMTIHPVTLNGTELSLNLVSMGNPHAVYFCVESPDDFPLLQIGPGVEKHTIFPAGTNFEAARIIDRTTIEARVWERGVGETLACGSGACAITVAACLHSYTDSKVDVKLPGGTLEVEWDGAGEVFLSGPAEIVFTGEWLDSNKE